MTQNQGSTMTRQERIDHMLSELGEGWEPRKVDWPEWLQQCAIVERGPVRVRCHPDASRHIASIHIASIEARTFGHSSSDDPRVAVDELLAQARRLHEEHAEILKAAEAARGWADR